MKEKPKSNMKLKPKSKSSSLKRSLSILKGGEGEEEQQKKENNSSFFSFLNKRDDKKPEDPFATAEDGRNLVRVKSHSDCHSLHEEGLRESDRQQEDVESGPTFFNLNHDDEQHLPIIR